MMMPPMQKMAAPLALASALCHIATISVIGNMHIQLSTVQDTATGPRRALLDSNRDALVTVAHMTKAVEHLQDTLGLRLTAVERENSELKVSLNALKNGQVGTEHGSRVGWDDGALDDTMASPLSGSSRESAVSNATKENTASVQADSTARRWANSTLHRRTQVAPQACARVQDFQALSAAAMDACCPLNGGGHRRLQASCALPATCPSVACAAVFVPFMDDCATMLATMPGVPVADFQSLAASCVELQVAPGAGQILQPVAVQMFRVLVNTEGAAQASAMFPGDEEDGLPLDPLQPLPPTTPSPPPRGTGGDETTTEVTQYHAECTAVEIASCVPPCNAQHHGFELLATIDGTDTKFSCNLAHGLYSWMGAASEGGYLGADVRSFFSAVVSGAAGVYIVTLTADAGIGTDLTVVPGQDVRISGDPGLSEPPSWGSGSFVVGERGSLSLERLTLKSSIAAVDGGSVLIVSTTFQAQTTLDVMRGSHLNIALSVLPDLLASTLMSPNHLSGEGSVVQLTDVTFAGLIGPITSTLTAMRGGEYQNAQGNISVLDSSGTLRGSFVVTTGPCVATEGGRCVGRPQGYDANEQCTIDVEVGGVLAACPVFDMDYNHGDEDYVSLNGQSCLLDASRDARGPLPSACGPEPCSSCLQHEAAAWYSNPDSWGRFSDGTTGCPAGAVLPSGGSVSWTSSEYWQGANHGGMPRTYDGVGGGWQICFL